MSEEPCQNCDGFGLVQGFHEDSDDDCTTCDGSGIVKKPGKKSSFAKEKQMEVVTTEKTIDVVEPPASPELQAIRDELFILQNIFSILGNATIRANECKKAEKVLDYIQAKIIVGELAVTAQLEKEAAK